MIIFNSNILLKHSNKDQSMSFWNVDYGSETDPAWLAADTAVGDGGGQNVTTVPDQSGDLKKDYANDPARGFYDADYEHWNYKRRKYRDQDWKLNPYPYGAGNVDVSPNTPGSMQSDQSYSDYSGVDNSGSEGGMGPDNNQFFAFRIGDDFIKEADSLHPENNDVSSHYSDITNYPNGIKPSDTENNIYNNMASVDKLQRNPSYFQQSGYSIFTLTNPHKLLKNKKRKDFDIQKNKLEILEKERIKDELSKKTMIPIKTMGKKQNNKIIISSTNCLVCGETLPFGYDKVCKNCRNKAGRDYTDQAEYWYNFDKFQRDFTTDKSDDNYQVNSLASGTSGCETDDINYSGHSTDNFSINYPGQRSFAQDEWCFTRLKLLQADDGNMPLLSNPGTAPQWGGDSPPSSFQMYPMNLAPDANPNSGSFYNAVNEDGCFNDTKDELFKRRKHLNTTYIDRVGDLASEAPDQRGDERWQTFSLGGSYYGTGGDGQNFSGVQTEH